MVRSKRRRSLNGPLSSKKACELEQMKSSQGRRVEHTGWLTYDGVYVTADFERLGAVGKVLRDLGTYDL